MSEWAIVGMLWCACSPIVLRFAKTVDTLVLQKTKKNVVIIKDTHSF